MSEIEPYLKGAVETFTKYLEENSESAILEMIDGVPTIVVKKTKPINIKIEYTLTEDKGSK